MLSLSSTNRFNNFARDYENKLLGYVIKMYFVVM